MTFDHFGPFSFARMGASAVREFAGSLDRLIAGRLWAKIVFALVLGILVGFALGPGVALVPPGWSEQIVPWLAFPGQIFLSLIQLVIIPLVFSSVVLGILGGENIQQLKSMGLRVGIYYVFTTVVAVFIGFVAAFLVKPGKFIDPKALKLESLTPPTPSEASGIQLKSVSETVTALIPNNPFHTLVSGEMLHIVLLAIFTGIALMSLKDEDAKPMVDLLNSFQKLSMTVTGWAMRLAPWAVFGFTARLLAQVGVDALLGLGLYVATVILGLTTVLLFYLVIVKVVGGIGPIEFLNKIKSVQLLAFSTSSSAAVMPLTIQTAETDLKIKPSVSQFVIPLGTTVNMDGTAMYQGVATIFLAQVFGVDLSVGQLILVVMTSTLSSIGAPGTPGVGMAILSVILTNVGIPPAGIVLIIGVDRLLDMCRTVINVTGDLTASVVMNRLD